MSRLAGRRVVITGAASGIGRASAELFVTLGARVLAVDLPGADIPHRSGIHAVATDVSAADAPDRIVAAACEVLGGLDVLFSNAGIAPRRSVAETTDGQWDEVMDVNLRAAFRLSRAAAPLLVASGAGRILFTSSVMALGADHGLAAYSASKAGLLGLVRTLALELGRHGVTVNAILPGAIVTGMTSASLNNTPAGEVWARKAALGRLGQPMDVAHVAAFLASAEAAFVTGQGVAVDGGLTLRI